MFSHVFKPALRSVEAFLAAASSMTCSIAKKDIFVEHLLLLLVSFDA